MLSNPLMRRLLWFAGPALVAGAWLAARSPGTNPAAKAPVAKKVVRYKPGHVLVRMAKGHGIAPVARALRATSWNPVAYTNGLYCVKADPGADVPAMVRAASAMSGVVKACPNWVNRSATVKPVYSNDPFVNRQWYLRRAKVQEAHGIIIGQRDERGPLPTGVILAIVDTGIDPSNPDLGPRLLPGGRFDEDGVPIGSGTNDDNGHGTAVAGVAAAITNNNVGIASPCWEGVGILPVKVNTPGTPDEITAAASAAGIGFATAQGADVINLSYGREDPDSPDPEGPEILNAVQLGAVVIASAGNTSARPNLVEAVQYPARNDNAIAVGSTLSTGVVAPYSNGGTALDLVAPGGNPPLPPMQGPQTIFSETVFTTTRLQEPPFFSAFGEYNTIFEQDGDQGSSVSSALVSGITAALIADRVVEGLGKTIDRVNYLRLVLQSTATNPRGAYSTDYGFGEVNMEAAIKASSPWIDTINPINQSSTPNRAEAFVFNLVDRTLPLPTVPADLMSFDAQRNPDTNGIGGEDITGLVIPGVAPGTNTYQPNYAPDPRALWNFAGSNRLNVRLLITPQNPGDPSFGTTFARRSLVGPGAPGPLNNPVPSRDYSFFVQPVTIQAGLRMISIPYELLAGSNPADPKNTIQQLFSLGAVPPVFARWVTPANIYAIYNPVGAPQDAEANLTTNTLLTVPNAKPRGVAFWARVPQTTQLSIAGLTDVATNTFAIRLDPGYTMIGDPYLQPVRWSAVQVNYQGETMSLTQAVARGLMDPTIWRWDGTRYISEIPPGGELRPFEGRWVRAFRPVTLLIPRGVSFQNGVQGP